MHHVRSKWQWSQKIQCFLLRGNRCNLLRRLGRWGWMPTRRSPSCRNGTTEKKTCPPFAIGKNLKTTMCNIFDDNEAQPNLVSRYIRPIRKCCKRSREPAKVLVIRAKMLMYCHQMRFRSRFLLPPCICAMQYLSPLACTSQYPIIETTSHHTKYCDGVFKPSDVPVFLSEEDGRDASVLYPLSLQVSSIGGRLRGGWDIFERGMTNLVLCFLG